MRTLALKALSLLVLLVASSGCSWSNPPTDLIGSWGGEHIALTVEETSAAVEFDCAHGRMDEPLTLDSQGRFSVAGVYVKEHGGPIREGEAPDSHPARYSGRVQGTRMSLEVELMDTELKPGPFQLGRGKSPQVYKCL